MDCGQPPAAKQMSSVSAVKKLVFTSNVVVVEVVVRVVKAPMTWCKWAQLTKIDRPSVTLERILETKTSLL